MHSSLANTVFAGSPWMYNRLNSGRQRLADMFKPNAKTLNEETTKSQGDYKYF